MSRSDGAKPRLRIVTEGGEYDIERGEWIESLEEVLQLEGAGRAARLLEDMQRFAIRAGIETRSPFETPYINTLPLDQEPLYPGDLDLEQRIRSLVRWNALAMVVRANREEAGIGGHISTFASCATLYEVGFHHFFRGRGHRCGGDHVYFQGHAAPGNYARAFLEGRLNEGHLRNFRREVRSRESLSSYPHPWLMPKFWEFPTVSMGLGPIQSIYRARFRRYLEDRGLVHPSEAKVWAFVGDGECDEPETLGSLTLAAREKLDNLIWVVNCNLQRLDGPVRGNGKIIQELETVFRGAGWNVIKVIWASEWDPLFERDPDGVLVRRLTELLDGDFQRIYVEGVPGIRERIFGVDRRLKEMIEGYTDEDLKRLRVGGHDPLKLYAAYRAAVDQKGRPTVILAKTIKGYGLGEAGEGRNVTHQQKKLTEAELVAFRNRFGIPVSDAELADVPFYRPPEDSPESRYIRSRREMLGGWIPSRIFASSRIALSDRTAFEELEKGSAHPVATTMAMVRLLSRLLQDPGLGNLVVPIVPDEARTFGMDALFRRFGIYSSLGQRYEPVDIANVLYYREAKDGQLLEEGITEAGAMCSFIAAGTSYAEERIATIPFFFFYSMFGFQRIGDLVWAAGDSRARGFLIGATAGRTTLAGEGLQHQDGQSQLLAMPLPNLLAYDPAFAYEIAVIVENGIQRMYGENEDLMVYLTVGNEPYPQPPMPEGVREGILRGMYLYRRGEGGPSAERVQLLASGALMTVALRARDLLRDRFGVAADVWSVPGWKQLRVDALEVERWNRLHPEQQPRVPFLQEALAREGASGVFVAVTDYLKALPDLLARWIPGRLIPLGTDGYGRSDSRAMLREFFEVDERAVALAALSGLAAEGRISRERCASAIRELGIDPEKPDPWRA